MVPVGPRPTTWTKSAREIEAVPINDFVCLIKLFMKLLVPGNTEIRGAGSAKEVLKLEAIRKNKKKNYCKMTFKSWSKNPKTIESYQEKSHFASLLHI